MMYANSTHHFVSSDVSLNDREIAAIDKTVPSNYMKDFKLFELRSKLTTGSMFPGVIYLLVILFQAFLALFDQRIQAVFNANATRMLSTVNDCPEIEKYRENVVISKHFLTLRVLYLFMLSVYILMFVYKVLWSVLFYACCPLTKYKMQKSAAASVPLITPNEKLASARSKEFRRLAQLRMMKK